MTTDGALVGSRLTDAMYINDNIVVRVLENILSADVTHRSVTAFLSANQTAPGVACELFFLEASPVAEP